MERIEGQLADPRELAKQALAWITCSKRPLTTLELQHALAVEIGHSSLDEDNLPEIEDVVSVCAGLVTIDEGSGIIRLVHYTTQEYFQRTWTSWFHNAQEDITKTCVTYLLFSAFKTGSCTTDVEFEERLRLNPLYDYAARNWAYYACAGSKEVEELILDLLRNDAAVSASSQAMMAYRTFSGYRQTWSRKTRGAHLAAYFGLEKAVTVLLKQGHHPNSRDTSGRTPLSWAAANGNEVVVKLLLATAGVDVDSGDYLYQTPLALAAESGHESVVKLLLATAGVYPEFKDLEDMTPLMVAAANGHEAVVKLLLAMAGVNVNAMDTSGGTPLWIAASNGHEGVVKLLLATAGVDVDSKDDDGNSPLWIAAVNGREEVVKLLLATAGVDVDSKNNDDETPLWIAAANGRQNVVKLLLATASVDVDSKNNNSETPLWIAASNGHEEVVKLLLATVVVDVDSESIDGETPLLIAARNGFEEVVKLLQSSGPKTEETSEALSP